MKTSGYKRIAERYVRALFEVAKSAQSLPQVEADLSSLGKALAESPEFQHFLTNPLLSRENQAQSMLAILAKMNAGDVTRQFIGMLVKHRRLAILPEVVTMFCDWASAARGELKAELISAAPLKPQEVAMVGERLGKAYGRKMNLEVRQDPSLLGGVVVRVGSLQLDSSLAGKLVRLGNKLKAA